MKEEQLSFSEFDQMLQQATNNDHHHDAEYHILHNNNDNMLEQYNNNAAGDEQVRNSKRKKGQSQTITVNFRVIETPNEKLWFFSENRKGIFSYTVLIGIEFKLSQNQVFDFFNFSFIF